MLFYSKTLCFFDFNMHTNILNFLFKKNSRLIHGAGGGNSVISIHPLVMPMRLAYAPPTGAEAFQKTTNQVSNIGGCQHQLNLHPCSNQE